MKKFQFSPHAVDDLRSIWAFVARDNVNAARKIRLQLLNACEHLAVWPKSGHSREDLTSKQLLFWPVGSYLIVYNPNSKPIDILSIVHGARDLLNFPVFS